MEVKIFDNVTDIVRDDMEVTISKDSKVSIAAACFSMYAYKELKKQLESVDEFRFIFTSPTFVTEKAEKQKREFYIPRLSRERSLYGTEFEPRRLVLHPLEGQFLRCQLDRHERVDDQLRHRLRLCHHREEERKVPDSERQIRVDHRH